MFGILDIIIFALYRINVRQGQDLIGGGDYSLTPFIYRSLLALFFDQEAGLFFLAPVYLLSIIGLSASILVDKAIKNALKIIFVISGYLITQGSLTAFGGGYDTGRSILPLIPFLAIFLIRSFENSGLKLIFWGFVIFSVIAGYLAAAVPWLAINYEKAGNGFLPSFLLSGQEHYQYILIFTIILFLLGFFCRPKFNWR